MYYFKLKQVYKLLLDVQLVSNNKSQDLGVQYYTIQIISSTYTIHIHKRIS